MQSDQTRKEDSSVQPLISVVVPTYNSEETLEKTLSSIRMQALPQEQLEIMVIDGGSTDKTLEIAQKYNVVIIDNPRRLPLYALELGFKHARGHYMLKTASDESLTDKNQIKRRLELFEKYPEVKCIGSNRLITPGFDRKNFSRSYLNLFGEPFTAFVYRTKGSVLESFKQNIVKKDEDGVCLLGVVKGQPYPILDGGATLLSLDYVRENFGDKMDDMSFILQMAEQIILKTGVVGYIQGDDVVHLPKASFKGYLKKIQYRVINNIFNIEASGYTNVAQQTPTLSRRKYWYVLYCASIIAPLVQSIGFALKYRDISLLAHFLYAEITVFMIAYYMLRKVLHLPAKNVTYG